MRISHIISENSSSFQQYKIRPALYDELNPAYGRQDYTSLIIGEMTIQARKGKARLNQLDLIKVSDLSVPDTDLVGDGGLAWRMNIGVKSLNQVCDSCLVGHFNGGLGKSFELVTGLSIYGLGKLNLQSNRYDQGTLALGPELGSFVNILNEWKIFISYQKEYYMNGKNQKFEIWDFQQRFGFNPNWDIRLDYLQRDDKQFSLSFGWYF